MGLWNELVYSAEVPFIVSTGHLQRIAERYVEIAANRDQNVGYPVRAQALRFLGSFAGPAPSEDDENPLLVADRAVLLERIFGMLFEVMMEQEGDEEVYDDRPWKVKAIKIFIHFWKLLISQVFQ